jgi:purine-binding chemotaxis protein CheW
MSEQSNPGADDPSAQYLTFTLGEEVFAMDIRTVREIIQYGPMTPVPLMPPSCAASSTCAARSCR